MDKRRCLQAAGLVLGVLAGCKSAGPALPPTAAAGGGGISAPPTCLPQTQVSITQVVVSGSTATITLNPEPVPLNQKDPTPSVRWRLPQGYAFLAADGVSFPVQNPPQPPGPAASSMPSPTLYEWCFQTGGPATWKYSLKFQDSANPPAVWQCDPTIVNSADLLATASVSVSCTRVAER